MRASLFYNPVDIVARLAVAINRRRRRRVLRGTPAEKLSLGHIDSLELLRLLGANPPQVIYDVGANRGTWSCLAKSLYPTARVEAFEPLPQHKAEFQAWTKSWANDIRLHPFALGPREGSADLHVTDFTDASSLLPLADAGRQEFHVEETRRETVRVATLDGLVAAGEIPPPDLIKLDVQGYELEVLRGATTCLAHCRAIICEVSFRPFYSGQPVFSDVLTFLAERGFRLHAFGSSLALGEPLVQADALFVRDA